MTALDYRVITFSLGSKTDSGPPYLATKGRGNGWCYSIIRSTNYNFWLTYYQGVDYFGKRIGFLKFKAEIIDKETGKQVSPNNFWFVLATI